MNKNVSKMDKNIISKAGIKNLKVTPQKLNLVAGLIRRKSVDNAILQLQYSKRRIAQDVLKCLKSAVANAENKGAQDVLHVDEVLVGKGMCMKRFRARARGRSTRIHKFFSSLTITLKTDDMKKALQSGNMQEALVVADKKADTGSDKKSNASAKATQKAPVKATTTTAKPAKTVDSKTSSAKATTKTGAVKASAKSSPKKTTASTKTTASKAVKDTGSSKSEDSAVKKSSTKNKVQ